MKEITIMNIASVVACSFAIAVGCKVTKSALPLLGMILIPRWSYKSEHKTEGENE